MKIKIKNKAKKIVETNYYSSKQSNYYLSFYAGYLRLLIPEEESDKLKKIIQNTIHVIISDNKYVRRQDQKISIELILIRDEIQDPFIISLERPNKDINELNDLKSLDLDLSFYCLENNKLTIIKSVKANIHDYNTGSTINYKQRIVKIADDSYEINNFFLSFYAGALRLIVPNDYISKYKKILPDISHVEVINFTDRSEIFIIILIFKNTKIDPLDIGMEIHNRNFYYLQDISTLDLNFFFYSYENSSLHLLKNLKAKIIDKIFWELEEENDEY